MKRIIIADDTAFMRIILRSHAEQNGFEVVAEARTGREAIAYYKLHRPGLVAMDVSMPEMDGLSAAKEILEYDPRAKIIMCSTIGEHDIVLEAIQCGARDFLVKPYQSERVSQALEYVAGL